MKGEQKGSSYYDEAFRNRNIFNVSYKDSPYWVHWTQVIQFLGHKNTSASILDVGCGPGQLAEYLFDLGFQNYTGFDFSEEAIKRARSLGYNYTFFTADALARSSYESDYDVAICLEVFEHLNEDKKIINFFQQGKKVIFSVPNFWDPSHVRRFVSMRQIKSRYYKLLDIQQIVKVGNIYVCSAIRRDFEPNIFQRFLKSRENITFSSFSKRLKSYFDRVKDSL
ncbi:MAG: 2-polyprenyl-3-methyl-5-hydroxy-6-metoxy-1,4-benzoquinol methylase [Bacteroidia bacterium]|jgi:2-polyprenyl-3-methyl-5-hydroxy-6-metoxy-1,4-benzoquinol methylase